MPNLKQLCTFLMATLFFIIVLAFINACFAGLLFLMVLLFEASEAAIVFKWVYICLFILEALIVVPGLYLSIVNERTEDNSGT